MGSIGQCDGTRKGNDKNTEELFNSLRSIGIRLNWDDLGLELSEEKIDRCRSKINEAVESMESDKRRSLEKYNKDIEYCIVTTLNYPQLLIIWWHASITQKIGGG